MNQLCIFPKGHVFPSKKPLPSLSKNLGIGRGGWLSHPWLFVIFFFLFYPLPVFAQLANTPWPMFQHDIQHTGQSPYSGPQKNTLSWKYQTGSEIMASPVLGTDGTIYVGSIDGKLSAINPSGAKKWSYTTGGEIYAAAVVDTNGVIYVGSEDSYLYAIQKDGTLKWRYKASGSISSAPAIDPKTGDVYFGSEDTYLYALNTGGTLKWNAGLDEEIWASPAISDTVLYIATLGGMVYAVNSSDGTRKWSYNTKDSISGSPAIDEKNKLLFFGSETGKVYALNVNDGSIKWTYTTGDAITSTPAIDTATGVNTVYVGSEDGNLYALDRTTGSLKWKYKAGDAISSSPAIGKNGSVYFGSSDKNIYSISKDGTLKWSYAAKDEIYSSPAIDSKGNLYIGSSDGYLYAIGTKTTTKLTADFTASPTTGEVPLTVQFTDQSTGEISGRKWDFGDGNTDSTQYPSHIYTTTGTFTVSLTVSGTEKSDTKTRENYISVTRKTSSITLTISTAEITFGQSLTLTGQIFPASQEEIALTFTNLDEDETETETATSNPDGSFILTDYFPPEGGSWIVVASWGGSNEYKGAKSNSQAFTVHQAELREIAVESSSPAIQINQTVDISGTIKLVPDNGTTQNEFLNEELKLIRIDPDGAYEDVIQTHPFLSGDQIHYEFKNVHLPVLGTWELLIGFDEDDNFTGNNSATIDVEVQDIPKDVAGYAILVEGRVKDKSGIDSHNLTANYVYKKLLERGFTDDEIYYFNSDDTQAGVDDIPSVDGVLDAIKTWAGSKMSKSPAPLFIVFVGHGDKEKFYLYPDTLKAGDLTDALSNLESQLSSNASEEALVIILGANHSGGFINSLSQSGKKRVIITSSDTEEIAYKGPLPPDETIRHGDYFVGEFFNYAARGFSLKKCYEEAAHKTAEFTENENGNGLNSASAGNGQYFDDSAQHPLLDDNGDGVGTNGTLSSLSGKDGALSADIVLGIGTTTTQLEITEVTDIITLEANDDSPTLFAKVNNTAGVDEVWTEIISPNHTLENKKDVTEQQVVSLPRFSNNDFDKAENKYLWNNFSDNKDFSNFGKTGGYEVFYFARDASGEITPFMESDVFRNAANNQPPASFTFLSPANGTETTVALTFDWEDSTDEDQDNTPVTYTFQISENADFNPVYYQKKGLTDSIVVVDKTAGLRDGTTYYWRVLAVDDKGGTTYIGYSNGTATITASPRKEWNYYAGNRSITTGTSSSFKPKLANGYPGFIKGFVFDNKTNSNLANATIAAKGTKSSYTTTESGAYFLQLNSGTYTVSVDASGYETTNKTIRVDALNTTTENIGLTGAIEKASISGTVRDKKKRKPLEGTTITVRKKGVTETATTDSNGEYSITGLESGKYTLTASMNNYKDYKTKIKLKAGQDKKLNIKMNKKK